MKFYEFYIRSQRSKKKNNLKKYSSQIQEQNV